MDRELLADGLHAFTQHERAWWKQDRRGRWVVLEPGCGAWLREVSPLVRSYIDLIAGRRGRRFSSLSRARAFARHVGGEVRHWRRAMAVDHMGRTITVPWRHETNPWARSAGLWSQRWAHVGR